jgi:perosamine synthetase
VGQPLLDGNERKYLLECLESGWISSDGPFVKRFEEEFASRVGRRFGVAVSSGTAALDIAVESLGLEPGDEVILPAFTIISCVGQIVRRGARPVLVDCDPATWNMDVSQVEAKVTPRTRAIMMVHTYGLPVDADPILALAARHGLKVIEDAAEAHGQTYKGRPCGSLGDLSTFSFYANKHVATGEGGMLLTDDERSFQEFRSLRNLCFQPEKRFVHERLGWNYRMSNLQAALGVAQLERLDAVIARKRRMGAAYTGLLSGLRSLRLPQARTAFAENDYWVYGIVLGQDSRLEAEEAIRLLAAKSVQCRPFFCPLHQQPVLRRLGLFGGERYPVAEDLYRKGLYLPSGPGLTEEQMRSVVEAVREVLS